MIKANNYDVEIKGEVDDLVSELTAVVHGFIEELSKDKESIDDSSRLFKGFLFYIQKDAEKYGLDVKITKDEKKEFEEKYKKSRETAEKFAKLMDGLLKALEDSDDKDSDDSYDGDDDDGVIGMCAIPANSKKGKAIMDILGIKPKDTKDDDETEDDIPKFLF
jgi:hypothetical protein